MSTTTVRPFEEADVDELLGLMKGLAVFEGYIDDFAVTASDLVEHGLGVNPRFEAFVAEDDSGDGGLLGMAVIYLIPWTYDLKPTVVLKELFVTEAARSRGAGLLLLKQVARRAAELGAPRVNWTVLPSNVDAQRFYERAGGAVDSAWQSWHLDEAAIGALAD